MTNVKRAGDRPFLLCHAAKRLRCSDIFNIHVNAFPFLFPLFQKIYIFIGLQQITLIIILPHRYAVYDAIRHLGTVIENKLIQTVNHDVAGSSPAGGAIKPLEHRV